MVEANTHYDDPAYAKYKGVLAGAQQVFNRFLLKFCFIGKSCY